MTDTIEKPAKVTEVTRFEYEGEYLDLTGPEAYELLAEYRAAAQSLHVAKKAAFDAEEKIKELMRGRENLRVDGEVKVSWTWQSLTKFDKSALAVKYPAIVDEFTSRVPNGKRVFNAKGVVGVD